MITSKEYKFLKKSKTEGFNWIARDKDWKLYIYSETPRRYSTIWNFGGATANIQEEHFTFIKWEDEKPTKIDDLIRDYESHQVIVGEKVKVTIPQFVAEWIEEWKDNVFIFEALSFMPENVKKWAMDNEEAFTIAWIYGYQVEKQYILKFSNGQYLYNCDLGMTDESLGCKLTKAEIESVDPRLMQFAVEVE